MPPRRIVPHDISLWPVPVGEGPHSDTEVQVCVTWVPHSGDSYAWQNLVEAFEAFSMTRFPAMVVPANVAVEATLVQLLSAALRRAASADNVRSFRDHIGLAIAGSHKGWQVCSSSDVYGMRETVDRRARQARVL